MKLAPYNLFIEPRATTTVTPQPSIPMAFKPTRLYVHAQRPTAEKPRWVQSRVPGASLLHGRCRSTGGDSLIGCSGCLEISLQRPTGSWDTFRPPATQRVLIGTPATLLCVRRTYDVLLSPPICTFSLPPGEGPPGLSLGS